MTFMKLRTSKKQIESKTILFFCFNFLNVYEINWMYKELLLFVREVIITAM